MEQGQVRPHPGRQEMLARRYSIADVLTFAVDGLRSNSFKDDGCAAAWRFLAVPSGNGHWR